MKRPIIRPIEFRDAAWLAEGEKKAFKDKAWTLADYCHVMAGKCEGFVVGKKPMAACFGDLSKYLHYEIFSVFTDPKHRRQGHAERLLENAIDSAKMHGKLTVGLQVLEANKGAVALYEKMGFWVVKRQLNHYGRGRHGLRMMKSLRHVIPVMKRGAWDF